MSPFLFGTKFFALTCSYNLDEAVALKEGFIFYITTNTSNIFSEHCVTNICFRLPSPPTFLYQSYLRNNSTTIVLKRLDYSTMEIYGI